MKGKILFILFFSIIQLTAIAQHYVLYGATTYGQSSGTLFCYEPMQGKFISLTAIGGEPFGGSLVQDTTTGYIYGFSVTLPVAIN